MRFWQSKTHRRRRTANRKTDGPSRQLRLEGLEVRELLASFYWTGATSAAWSVATNWNAGNTAVPTPGVPGANDTLVFQTAGTNGFSPATAITATTSDLSLTGLSITLDDSTAGSLDFQISGNPLDVASLTVNVAGADTDGIDAAIVGSGGLTKTGTGTLHLGGANTYGGPTNVNGGKLQAGYQEITAANFSGAGGTVNGYQDFFSASARNSAWAVLGPGGDVYAQTGTGLLHVGTANGDPNHLAYEPAGLLASTDWDVLARVRLGTAMTGAVQSTQRGGITAGANPTDNNGRGVNELLQPATSVQLLDDGLAWGPTVTTSYNVGQWYWMRLTSSGAGSQTAKFWPADGITPEPAAGTTWTRPNRSGFAGITASSNGGALDMDVDYILIQNAALPSISGVGVVGSAGSLPSGSAVTVAGGATLDLGGASQTIGSLAGAGTVVNTGSQAVTLTTGGDGLSTAFSGTIVQGAETLSLVKTGAGAMTLGSANSYSGPTRIAGGAIVEAANNAVPAASAVTVDGGGTWDLNGHNASPPTLTLSSSAAGTGAVVSLGSATLTYRGTLQVNGSPTDASPATISGPGDLAIGLTQLTVTGSGNGLISARIVDGAVAGYAFDRSTGFLDAAGLNLVGNASVAAPDLQLNPSASGQQGAAWTTAKYLVTGGFTSDFTLNFANPSGGGADGIAFAIQNGSSTLNVGENGPTANALSLSFNSWNGGNLTSSLIRVFENGTQIGPNRLTAFDLSGAGPLAARVEYVPGELKVYFDFNRDGTLSADDLAFDLPVNLATDGAADASGAAWLGFSSRAGGSYEQHLVKNWTFEHAGSLLKTGAGTLALAGANDYSGVTHVSAGTLALGADDAIPDGADRGGLILDAVLDMAGHSDAINSVTGLGTIDNTAGGAATLSVGTGDQSSIFRGVLQNTAGSLGLTKVGTGTLTLGGTSTYDGPTNVNAGTLKVGYYETTFSNFSGFGAAVNGYQDFFTTSTRDPAWTVSGPGGDVYTQAGNGLLHVATAGGDPNHLLYEPAGLTASTDWNVLARVRINTAMTGGIYSGQRGGVGAAVEGSGQGFNDLFQPTSSVVMLDDARAWGPTLPGTYGVGTWYWMRLTCTAGNVQTGAIWPADGVTPEPAATPWNRTARNGFAGITASSGGALDMDVDYILIRGAGLPSINAGLTGFGGVLPTNTAVTVTGGATLDLGGVDQTIGSLAGAGHVVNVGGPVTFTVGGNNSSTTFSGTITDGTITDGTGTLTLVKTGTGALTLGGANGYSGPTLITAGSIVQDVDNAVPAGAAVTVDAGGTWDLNNHNASPLSLTVSSSPAGTGAAVALGSGTLTYRGTIQVNGAPADASPATLSGSGRIAIGLTKLTVTGPGNSLISAAIVDASAPGFDFDRSAGFPDATGLNFVQSASVVSPDLELTPDAGGLRGSAWTAAKYPVTGGFTSDFTLDFINSVNAGADGIAFAVQNNANTLDVTGAAENGPTANALSVSFNSWNGGSTTASLLRVFQNGVQLGADRLTGFDVSGAGPLLARVQYVPGNLKVYFDFDRSGTLTADDLAFDLPVDLATDGAADAAGTAWLGFSSRTGGAYERHLVKSWTIDGVGSLVKTGAGTLGLSGANDYDGATVVSAGTLQIAGDNTLPDGPGRGNLVLSSVLDLAGHADAINALTGSGTVDNLSPGTTGILSVGAADTSSEFDGVFQNTVGTVGLTKIGLGTVTLGGVNTYAGPTDVAAGTLRMKPPEVAPANFSGFGGTVNGYQDFFTSAVRNVAWVPTGPGGDVYAQAGNGLLHVAAASGDPNHLLLRQGIAAGTDWNVLARVRLNTAMTGGVQSAQRGGIVVASNPGDFNGRGVNELLQPATTVLLLDDGVAWGPTVTTSYDAGQWYWMRLTSSGTNTQTAKFWPADGVTPEPAASVTWSQTNRSGYPGITASSAGALDMDVDYVLIQGIGMPSITAGTLATAGLLSGVSPVTVALGATLDLGGSDQSIGSLAGDGAVTTGIAVPLTLTTGGDNTSTNFAGTILDGQAALSLVKIGTGTQTLSGANAYTGNTQVLDGTLALGADDALPDATHVSVGGAAASLDVGTHSDSVAGVQLVDGQIVGTTGVLASLWTYDLQNGSVSAILGGSVSLNKMTGGTVILSGANQYTGDTIVTAGALRLGADNVLPDGAGHGDLDVLGTLDLAGHSETINGLTGTGIIDNSTAGAGTLSVGADDQTSIFYGTLRNTAGTLGLTKIGTGTLALAGVNTYSGPTAVSDGVLKAGLPDVANFAGAGTTVNGFQDFFTATARDAAWVVSTIGGSDVYSQVGNGLLHVSGSNGDPNHLIYEPAGLPASADWNVLARVRLNTAMAVDDHARGGIAAAVEGNAEGYNELFRSYPAVPGPNIRMLDDHRAWHPSYVATGYSAGEWYWMRLTSDAGGTQTAKFWPADGVTPEPAAATTWNQAARTGFAGLTASSTGQPLDMDVDYILIQNAALPAITAAGRGYSGSFSPLSAVTVAGSGVLDLGGVDQTIGSLSGSGLVTNSAGTPATLTTGGDNSSTAFSGLISESSSPVSLTKAGSGTLALSGNNAYTGATSVNGGMLIIDGDQSAATGPVTVAAGAALSGSGTAGGSITVDASGKLTRGAAGPLTTLADLTLQPGGQLLAVFPNSADYRQIIVQGTVHLTDGVLTLQDTTPPAFGSPVTLVDNQGAQALDGQFAGIAEGGQLVGNLYAYTLSYNAASAPGNDVTLNRQAMSIARVVYDAGQETAADDLASADGVDPLVQAGLQHSTLTRIVVGLHGLPDAGAASAFSLKTAGGVDIPLDMTQRATPAGPELVFTLRAGSPYVAAYGGGWALVDGDYAFTIDQTLLHDVDGGALQAGRVDDFYRYLGDTDGDRDVDGSDLYVMRRAMAGDVRFAALQAVMDFNGDGHVDARDYREFRLRYGRRLL